jgi:hypothetical protein
LTPPVTPKVVIIRQLFPFCIVTYLSVQPQGKEQGDSTGSQSQRDGLNGAGIAGEAVLPIGQTEKNAGHGDNLFRLE